MSALQTYSHMYTHGFHIATKKTHLKKFKLLFKKSPAFGDRYKLKDSRSLTVRLLTEKHSYMHLNETINENSLKTN